MHGTKQGDVTKTAECRHGIFTWYAEDRLIGLSLDRYAEYSEGEVVAMKKCLRPGNTVIDVGANIGAFTVPMAQIVGESGIVYAFEASYKNARLLRKNIHDNRLVNVSVIERAASSYHHLITISNQDAHHAYNDTDRDSFDSAAVPIDSLNLEKCHFIKIDVDAHELEVLQGAEETIKRCQPVIYVENEREERSQELLEWLIAHDYRCYWHRPVHFNPDNFRKDRRNIFGNLISIMMLCVPNNGTSELRPNINKAWNLRGLDEVADIRQDDMMYEREIGRYRDLARRCPDDFQARLLAATMENMMQRPALADELIEENLQLNPDHTETLRVKGLMQLQRGNWHEGWKTFETRFNTDRLEHLTQFGGNRTHDVPKWDGKPTDKRVLVWSEQGFGDQVMFGRFFKQVKALAPNAVLEVHPDLFELFDFWHSRQLLGLPERGDLYRLRRSLPSYDFHCSLLSVPALIDAGEKEIKIKEPYLDVDPMLILNWLGVGNHGFAFGRHPMNEAMIGFCGKGSPLSERPYNRDLPGELAAELANDYGPFFSLEQQGQFESFAVTAGALKALKLVITVDTSVAHLAGAMGVPVWLLLATDPDWRWSLKGETTLWYHSMRIFRQSKFRDWKSVIEKVRAELDQWQKK
jgi:FkbM family methyltransferase